MIKIACSSCGARLSVPEDSRGRKGRCPRCKETMTVPWEDADEPWEKVLREKDPEPLSGHAEDAAAEAAEETIKNLDAVIERIAPRAPAAKGPKLKKQMEAMLARCAPFVRDTTLPDACLEGYQVGRFLQEPTYCDASHRIAGFVAPHRFLIISANAVCLDEGEPDSRGLCVWRRDSHFKVMDRIVRGSRAQITLLEIPEPFLPFFQGGDQAGVEEGFVRQAREMFEECRHAKPWPPLDTDAWRDRVALPIGVDDSGNFYPPQGLEPPTADNGIVFDFGASRPPLQPGDTLEAPDGVRRGDIVVLDRAGPSRVLIRSMPMDQLSAWPGPKYLCDRGDRPGSIRLTNISEYNPE